MARASAWERALWAQGYRLVAGLDEVGRGPLAGPVVAAAVILPPGRCITGATDSKLLDDPARRRLGARIRRTALAWSLGAASAAEVDRLDIRRATVLAFRRALARLPMRPEHVLIDGLPMPEFADFGVPTTAVVDGDARVHVIACASILAKVARDELMERLARRYPGYGWERNRGYATPEHWDALARLGCTPHHRRSFADLAARPTSARGPDREGDGRERPPVPIEPAPPTL